MNEDIKRILQREKQILEEVLNMENDENENIFPYYIKILKSYEGRLIELDRLLNLKFKNLLDFIEEEKEQKRRLPLPIIAPPNKREISLEYLRDFIKHATELIIIDPYFFHVDEAKVKVNLEEIVKTLCIKKKKLKELTVIYNSKNGNSNSFKVKLKNVLSQYYKGHQFIDTPLFHDRLIIKDNLEALVIGTSLNGLGKSKYSFINQLEKNDLNELYNELSKNNILRKNIPSLPKFDKLK